MEVDVLQSLHLEIDPERIAKAIDLVLGYRNTEKPFLLIYHFGPKEG